MALVGIELETLVSESDALTTAASTYVGGGVKYVRLLLLFLRIELLHVLFFSLLFSSYAFKDTHCALRTIFL